MTKQHELIDAGRFYVTWTSPSEWARYRSRAFWFLGFGRATPTMPVTYVRILGLEIEVGA